MSHSFQQNFKDSLRFFDSELFADIQKAAVFDDSKTFADAEPIVPLSDILGHYATLKDKKLKQSGEAINLKDFIYQYFVLPEHTELTADNLGTTVEEHIDTLWTVLQKNGDTIRAGSLLPLKHPYIVPGGRFREIYYWDSYFTALGLIEADKVEVVESMFHNFIDLQSRYGCIPNGNRSYYHSRSQPPVLALLADLLMPYHQHDKTFLTYCVEGLEAEYRFWMRGCESLTKNRPIHQRVVRMPDGSFLNRYWDSQSTPRPESYREDIELAQAVPLSKRPEFYRNIRAACESGWDFSSRWLADDQDLRSICTTQIMPVDLNCLLYQLESQLAKLCSLLGEQERGDKYRQKAAQRQAAIKNYLWSPDEGFFFDFDLTTQTQSRVKSLAGVLPLFSGIATPKQATKVAAVIENQFMKPGGLITTLTGTGQQWDSPNGWAPLHWFAVQGLSLYKFDTLAENISRRWLNTVEDFFARSGKLMEKYDVCEPVNQAGGGEYDVQEGFGWTNGVARVFRARIVNGERN